MKKTLKYILILMTLAICFTVVAAAESTLITYSWVDASEYNENGNLAYDLTINAKQRNDEVVGTLYTKITFNNEVVIPITSADYETAIELTDGEKVENFDPYWTTEAEVGTGKNKKTYTYTQVQADWSTVGNKTTLEFTIGSTDADKFDFTDLDIMTIAFKLADGKTVDDITATDIVIDEIYLAAGQDAEGNAVRYGYKYTGTTVALGELDFVNELAPEAEIITIPVLAGDKIYLQDGTVETAEATGDYEVPATIGYVAVNTGNEAQATWYVDGTTATKVHTNGVLGSDLINLRDRTAVVDTEGNNLGDRNGLRFATVHNPKTRAVESHEVTEVGFVMTAESSKVIDAVGENYVLDMAMVESGKAKSDYAYRTGVRNWAQDTEDDEAWIIRATFYNIPITESGVQTVIASRPYYKVGETYVYGEITKTTLYAEAKAIKDDATAWEACTEPMQNYINEILFCVEGTDMVVDEVIIDVSGLYE